MTHRIMPHGLIAPLLAVLTVVPGCMLGEKERYVALLAQQHARYPQMEIQDVYKHAYEASHGSTHMAASDEQAAKYLLGELSALIGKGNDPLCEPLVPSGQLVRFHLRPFVQSGGLPEDLIAALVQTRESFTPSTDRLERYWGYAEAAAAEGTLPFTIESMRAYFDARVAEGYPAVNHSRRFLMVYRPAYRVVLRKHLPMPC